MGDGVTAGGLAARALRTLPPPLRDTIRATGHRVQARRRLAEHRPFVERIDAAVGGFAGKRVVEIGADFSGSLMLAVERLHAPAELVGLNPGFGSKRFTDRSRLESVDARASGLDEDSVDVVISSSAFEHVHRLDEVLVEMHRILRPGGTLFSHFGPLWSTSYGHHLWVRVGDELLTYHNVILPPWCHLLRTPEELAALCRAARGEEAVEPMVRFITASPEQNRVFFSDYERIFAESPFEVPLLKGYDAPGLAAKYPSALNPVVLDELAERFPDQRGFLYDGITVLLRKSD